MAFQTFRHFTREEAGKAAIRLENLGASDLTALVGDDNASFGLRARVLVGVKYNQPRFDYRVFWNRSDLNYYVRTFGPLAKHYRA